MHWHVNICFIFSLKRRPSVVVCGGRMLLAWKWQMYHRFALLSTDIVSLFSTRSSYSVQAKLFRRSPIAEYRAYLSEIYLYTEIVRRCDICTIEYFLCTIWAFPTNSGEHITVQGASWYDIWRAVKPRTVITVSARLKSTIRTYCIRYKCKGVLLLHVNTWFLVHLQGNYSLVNPAGPGG